jgi:hypothetical protein
MCSALRGDRFRIGRGDIVEIGNDIGGTGYIDMTAVA